MANLEKGTVVAKGACACCGKTVPIKLNKNGIAYYYCNWPDEDGERCSHHQKWGRVMSQKMQADYLATRKKTKKDAPRDEEPAHVSDHTQPAEHGGGDQDRDDGDIFARYG